MPAIVLTSQQFAWRKVLDALNRRIDIGDRNEYSEGDSTYRCMVKVLRSLNRISGISPDPIPPVGNVSIVQDIRSVGGIYAVLPINVSGTGKVLVVLVSTYNSNINGMTLNGVPLTFLPGSSVGVYGGSGTMSCYYLIAPANATGAMLAATRSDIGGEYHVRATLFNGANQSSPLRTPATLAALGSDPSTASNTVSPASGVGDIVVDASYSESVGDWGPDVGQTLLEPGEGRFDYSTKTGEAGSTSMTWNGSATQNSHLAVSVKP